MNGQHEHGAICMTYDELLDGMKVIYALLVSVVTGCSSTAAKPTRPAEAERWVVLDMQHP